jgi:hypothetical protein
MSMFKNRWLLPLATAWALLAPCAAQAVDPLASNNGIYPPASSWERPYRSANFRYPAKPVPSAWLQVAPKGPLTVAKAQAYADAIKRHLAPSLRQMIEAPDAWSPATHGWYDMPWVATGDAEDGREPILGSFTGQVLPQATFKDSGLTTDIQNHTVIYYDATAAATLKKLWANPFKPDRNAVNFAPGSIVIKAGAVSATPAQWPILEGTATWTVYRPSVAQVQLSKQGQSIVWQPELTPLRALQFDIIVKDPVASPKTGWVFITYIHDARAPGQSPWDKLVPLGVMWGNDPQVAHFPEGRDPKGAPLTETWLNPAAPSYSKATDGWGGRLSGPIDVSARHNVVLTNGKLLGTARASSCMSCHGTAQFPALSNFYPSPNRTLPMDGQPFPLFVPGSNEWARWFQSRWGQEPQDKRVGSVALDYDMLVMIALSSFDAASGQDIFMQRRAKVH